MAASSSKKRHVENEESSSSASDDNTEESQDEQVEDEELDENDREIQVDFEGQSPRSEDFAGIRSLLNQLFLKAHINLSQLADLIVNQSQVGSVLKQCLDLEDEESDDEDSVDEVFGVSTVINLSYHQNEDSVKQLSQYLVSRSGGKLDSVIKNPKNCVGFLINERFINIPPQVSVPLLENLSLELEEARKKGEPFDFTHFILISKLHEPVKSASRSNKKVKGDSEVLWVNAEEESIADMGEMVADFSVRSESDAAVSGSWDEEDEQFDPKRRIFLFQANQWPDIVGKIKSFLN